MKQFLSLLLACCCCVAIKANDKNPNIIVVLADDLGYGDLSCYGATEIVTPNIDRLAKEGRRFTSGYCSASTCTPTRYSLLTGNYAFRTKGTGIAPPNAAAIIQPGITTLPMKLQKAGYRTAVIGKWHLGLGKSDAKGKRGGPDWNGELRPGPLEIGFHECFLLPTTNDRVPQVYVKDHGVLNLDPSDPLWVGNKKPGGDHPTGKTHRSTLKMDWSHGHNATIHNGISRIGFYTGGDKARFRDEDLADRWVKESIKFIEANKEKPFFLFFASHDIHVPRMPHERFQRRSKLGYRGDAILQLDWCVGELIATIDRLGLSDNTLIVFCSDNGPVLDDGYKDGAVEKNGNHRSGGPFSGGKYSIYEGGTRTPFITRWKGTIKPAVSDQIVCTIDMPASFASLVGQDIAHGEFLDSFDVMNELIGRKGSKGRDHLVQQTNNSSNLGFRKGNWKLHRSNTKSMRNVVVEEKLKNTRVPKYQLFDLSKDLAEKKNVAEEFPDVAKRMQEELERIIGDGRSRR